MSWTKRLRFNHLNLLVVLAETGSLSEAARTTHTTQPALSRWIKELEEDVGSQLFERHARGITPTPAGKMLLTYAQRITSQAKRAQQNIDALKEGSSRSVAIGTSPASAPSFVPAAIARFLKQHPNSKIKFYENTMNALIAKLELGELDLVVGRLDNYQPQPDMQSEVLYKERICIVSRLSHPLAQRGKLSWDDLYQYDWIVWPEGTPIRSKLDIALTTSGRKPPNYRIESNSQVGNLWLLQFTDMLSIASERVAIHFHERGLMTPLNIEIDSGEGAVGMVWRDEENLDCLILNLLDSFRSSKGFI